MEQDKAVAKLREIAAETKTDLSPAQLENLAAGMEGFSVFFPSRDDQEKYVEQIVESIPRQQGIHLPVAAVKLVKQALAEATFFQTSYWLASFILYLLGLLLNRLGALNPIYALLLLSPVPIITALGEILKGREENLVELERSCPVSSGQVFLSRLAVVGLYAFILNSLLVIIIGDWKLAVYWLVSFNLFMMLSLLLVSWLKIVHVSLGLASIWAAASFFLLSNPAAAAYLERVHLFSFIAVICISLGVSLLQLRNILRQRDLGRGFNLC